MSDRSQPRSAGEQGIVLASGNAGKLEEIESILAPHGVNVVLQSAFNTPEADETGLSFVENAILKARNAAAHCGLAAIADDSGIEVDALNGAPGVYSARFAGPNATDQQNLDKLLADMRDVPESERGARFHCVMVFLERAKDPTPVIFHGVWEGRLLLAERGENGFGYDPIFYVPSHGCASAELDAGEKNRLSHRGQAAQRLGEYLNERAIGNRRWS
jgi:XTP/dITP diphosphohydrolase